MEKDKVGSRLIALDGLRGFAIILVFLNHISTTYLHSVIPFNLLGWFFGDGVTGVTFLFILSGFLMASIYPNPSSSLSFLQKRYTRIFPLFLSMCAVMFAYHLLPQERGIVLLSILLLIVSVFHLLWVYLIKPRNSSFKRVLFLLFLFLQGFIGLFYVLWIMRHPPIVFNQLLPAPIRESMIFLVNATLTLPLGNYIPMLDGVYWTLVAEVLFYVLYPILVVPLIQFVRLRSNRVRLLFFVASVLFIAGITLLSKKVLLVSMIQPALWLYFITGVILANIYHKKEKIFHKYTDIFSRIPLLVGIFIFVAILFSEHMAETHLSSDFGPWIRMSYAIPLTFLVGILLNQKTSLHRFFSKKIWILLGTISYSIYLSHAFVIHLAERIFTPTNFLSNFLYVVLTFGFTVIIASFLYWALEKPYFSKTKSIKNQSSEVSKRVYHPRLILGILVGGYIITLLFIYSSQLNFFSMTYPVKKESITPTRDTSLISLKDDPVVQATFEGKANDLGIISAKFFHDEQRYQLAHQTLVFTLKEVGVEKPITVATYTLDYFNSHTQFPFGFPKVHDSLGKTFIATFALSNKASPDFAIVDTSTFQVIYPADKKSLLSNPQDLVTFLNAKLLSIFSSRDALVTFLLGLPLLIISIFLSRKKANS